MRPLLGGITCPVLALNGTKDVQVSYEDNLGALEDGLKACDACIEAVEGVNHLFQHCRTGMPNEYRSIEETFSQDVIERMILYINSIIK